MWHSLGMSVLQARGNVIFPWDVCSVAFPSDICSGG